MRLGQQLLELGVLGLELTQPLRHSSLIRMPASACLRKPTICSSVNQLFFMSVIFLVVDFQGPRSINMPDHVNAMAWTSCSDCALPERLQRKHHRRCRCLVAR